MSYITRSGRHEPQVPDFMKSAQSKDPSLIESAEELLVNGSLPLKDSMRISEAVAIVKASNRGAPVHKDTVKQAMETLRHPMLGR